MKSLGFVGFIVMVSTFACGDGTSGPPPGGTTACGEAGESAGAECTGLAQCGNPGTNLVTVQFCEHCFLRPDTHVCEAGTCRPLDASGDIEGRFTIPAGAREGKSVTTASVNPIMADGTRVTCNALMSGCEFRNNAAINTGNSNFKNLAQMAQVGTVFSTLVSADVGQGRLLAVFVTSDVQGKGSVLAKGCVDDIAVTTGQTSLVEVVLEATE